MEYEKVSSQNRMYGCGETLLNMTIIGGVAFPAGYMDNIMETYMHQYTEFQTRKGIVTGSASGIGRATALYLGGLGAELVLADFDVDGANKVAEEIAAAGGKKSLAVKTDIANEENVKSLVKTAAERLGDIDFLVNSAGILRRTPFLEITTDEWDLMMNVNLRGQYIICREVLRHMQPKGKGVIVNVASLAGRTCSILGGAHYTTAKHALVGFSRHLAREFAGQGIRINAFCPGATRTPMVEDRSSAEELNRLDSAIPRGTMADPMDHATVIAFMLSDASKNIIGACIDSNGGSLMI